ncbi:helix-turn-helix domain-containing protein [Streptomyces laculatispora]|uniref:helix-turn-helix domain-containing protein n=1 Tax=Streptomyces laculatispora TaxID=887464 RepID=UPI001A93B8F9|nr:helix-turn-helix domain-containing protein [Streptomyces laculatispora]MBO0918299.1 helix-turn-helix domain-containing protein [Streptomyces laculatispora]
MSVQDPPPAAWRYCGDQLKRWRTRAGVSREELGAAAKYAPDTIKSMEQGVRMPTPQAKAASLLGPMLLLETVDHERLAFTEGPSMSQLTADAEVVGTQAERISMLRMEALSSAGSADFIKRMVDEL